MEHKHKYDKDGKQICCTEEGKINAVADRRLTQELGDKACCAVDAKVNPSKMKNSEKVGHKPGGKHTDDDGHDHSAQGKSTFQLFLPAMISFVILMAGLAMDHLIPQFWFKDGVRIIRSEEHTSNSSHVKISYAVFCLKKKKQHPD